ncbi:uncharacterized protein LOC142225214 [Haematobia irritans]|uniref:uncharacterized protein LOC142225214 n=1 Tax=Haematobia irritans TaxID=7368 RepID=UPI003F4F8607
MKRLGLWIFNSIVVLLWGHTQAVGFIGISENENPIKAAIADIKVELGTNVNEKLYQDIQKSIHWKTNACENFLHYACGNWSYFSEPQILDILHILDYKNNEEFRQILDQRNSRYPDINFMKHTRLYYESCKRVEKRGKRLNPLEYLKWLEFNENLTWEAFDERSDGPKRSNRLFNWIKMLAIFRKYGLNNLIIHEYTTQSPWSNKTIVAVQKPYRESDQHFLGPLEDEHRKFTLWNISDTIDHDKFVEFDLQLKEIVDYYEDERDERRIPTLTTFEKLKELQLDWLAVYLIVTSHPYPIDPKMEIFINDMGYMKTVKLFLDEVEDLKLLAQYLQLNFLSGIVNGFKDPGYYGCTRSTRQQFPLVMQWLYKNHHPEISHDFYEIHLLFTNLKRVMRKRLTSSVYDNRRDTFLKKLDNLKLKMLNVWQPSLEHYYEGLHLDPIDYIGNRLQIQHKYFQVKHPLLASKTNQGSLEHLNFEKFDTVESILPFVVTKQNLIILPVTTLQYPLYHSKFNETFIFSSLGFLLAQEIVNIYKEGHWIKDRNGRFSLPFMQSNETGGINDFSSFALELALEAYTTLPSFSI